MRPGEWVAVGIRVDPAGDYESRSLAHSLTHREAGVEVAAKLENAEEQGEDQGENHGHFDQALPAT